MLTRLQLGLPELLPLLLLQLLTLMMTASLMQRPYIYHCCLCSLTERKNVCPQSMPVHTLAPTGLRPHPAAAATDDASFRYAKAR